MLRLLVLLLAPALAEPFVFELEPVAEAPVAEVPVAEPPLMDDAAVAEYPWVLVDSIEINSYGDFNGTTLDQVMIWEGADCRGWAFFSLYETYVTFDGVYYVLYYKEGVYKAKKLIISRTMEDPSKYCMRRRFW